MTSSVSTSLVLSGRTFLRCMTAPQIAHRNMRPSRFSNSVNDAMVYLSDILVAGAASLQCVSGHVWMRALMLIRAYSVFLHSSPESRRAYAESFGCQLAVAAVVLQGFANLSAFAVSVCVILCRAVSASLGVFTRRASRRLQKKILIPCFVVIELFHCLAHCYLVD